MYLPDRLIDLLHGRPAILRDSGYSEYASAGRDDLAVVHLRSRVEDDSALFFGFAKPADGEARFVAAGVTTRGHYNANGLFMIPIYRSFVELSFDRRFHHVHQVRFHQR